MPLEKTSSVRCKIATNRMIKITNALSMMEAQNKNIGLVELGLVAESLNNIQNACDMEVGKFVAKMENTRERALLKCRNLTSATSIYQCITKANDAIPVQKAVNYTAAFLQAQMERQEMSKMFKTKDIQKNVEEIKEAAKGDPSLYM